jgi:hypothetical protein
VTSDGFNRIAIDASGTMSWGKGSAAADTFLTRLSNGGLSITGGNVGIGTAAPALQLQISKAMGAGVNLVAFSATPTFDASLGNTQTITLTANVTSSILSNAAAGEWLVFDIIQDATGSRTFAWPTNVLNAGVIGSMPSKHNIQMFYYDGTNARAVGAMLKDQS